MRAPISWLAEHVEVPDGVTPRELADAIIRTGTEVESVDTAAEGLSGPIVVGRVLAFDDEPQKNGKTIRWCQVDVGEDEPRGIVCGALNFATDDLVVVADAQLAHRADHAVGHVPVRLAGADLESAGQDRSGPGHHDQVAGREVVRAADDAVRLRVADVHRAPADRLAVLLRLVLVRQNLADHERAGQLGLLDGLDLEAGPDQLLPDVATRDLCREVDVLTKP